MPITGDQIVFTKAINKYKYILIQPHFSFMLLEVLGGEDSELGRYTVSIALFSYQQLIEWIPIAPEEKLWKTELAAFYN